MAESVVGETHASIRDLKNNNDGDLQLQNGRLHLTGVGYTTIGTETFGNEAVAGQDNEVLRRAKNATNHTGNIYLNNGNLYANGYGQITLVD
jgi:hypothetical protein